ncbi:hypothetical protein M427DRAFT_130157 [Gonapodya prolifera JEL478]|uniref:Uncharacterized protein n=1 Tax=Gonapodya prolifera (strain JEL478) TaxID=1344416 RepID=A0A139B0J5_GONPJ|nr:hypothetical protein M427DRAFT_130157 [Gonapodya prolifera JEL478]|eukprot:KXS22487.1 hypothetical protein M427DRAFT_130157 [Gonapodya prolifera JEL478]
MSCLLAIALIAASAASCWAQNLPTTLSLAWDPASLTSSCQVATANVSLSFAPTIDIIAANGVTVGTSIPILAGNFTFTYTFSELAPRAEFRACCNSANSGGCCCGLVGDVQLGTVYAPNATFVTCPTNTTLNVWRFDGGNYIFGSATSQCAGCPAPYGLAQSAATQFMCSLTGPYVTTYALSGTSAPKTAAPGASPSATSSASTASATTAAASPSPTAKAGSGNKVVTRLVSTGGLVALFAALAA